MGMNEDILQIAKRYTEAKDHITTEEATKHSLIAGFSLTTTEKKRFAVFFSIIRKIYP